MITNIKWDSTLLLERQRVKCVQLLDVGTTTYKNEDLEKRVNAIKVEADTFRQLSPGQIHEVLKGELPFPQTPCVGFQESRDGIKKIWYENIHKLHCIANPWVRVLTSTVLATQVLREIDWDVPFEFLDGMAGMVEMIAQLYSVERAMGQIVIRAHHEVINLAIEVDDSFIHFKIAERMMKKVMMETEVAIPLQWQAPVFPQWTLFAPKRESRERVTGVYVTNKGIVDFSERADLLGALLPQACSVYVWKSRDRFLLEELYPHAQVGALIRNDPEGIHMMTALEEGVFFLAIVDHRRKPVVKVDEQLRQWGFGPLRYQALTYRSTFVPPQLCVSEIAQLSLFYEVHGKPVIVIKDEEKQTGAGPHMLDLEGQKIIKVPEDALVLALDCPSTFSTTDRQTFGKKVLGIQESVHQEYDSMDGLIALKTWMNPDSIPCPVEKRFPPRFNLPYNGLPWRTKLVTQPVFVPEEGGRPLSDLWASSDYHDLASLADPCEALKSFLLLCNDYRDEKKCCRLLQVLFDSCQSLRQNAMMVPVGNPAYSQLLIRVMRLSMSHLSDQHKIIHQALCMPYTERWYGSVTEVLYYDVQELCPRRVILSPGRWCHVHSQICINGYFDLNAVLEEVMEKFSFPGSPDEESYMDACFNNILVRTAGPSIGSGTGTWKIFGVSPSQAVKYILASMGILTLCYGDDHMMRCDLRIPEVDFMEGSMDPDDEDLGPVQWTNSTIQEASYSVASGGLEGVPTLVPHVEQVPTLVQMVLAAQRQLYQSSDAYWSQ